MAELLPVVFDDLALEEMLEARAFYSTNGVELALRFADAVDSLVDTPNLRIAWSSRRMSASLSLNTKRAVPVPVLDLIAQDPWNAGTGLDSGFLSDSPTVATTSSSACSRRSALRATMVE